MLGNPLTAMTVLIVLVPQSQFVMPLSVSVALAIVTVLALAVAFRDERKPKSTDHADSHDLSPRR